MQTLEQFIESLPSATSNPRKRSKWIAREHWVSPSVFGTIELTLTTMAMTQNL